MLYHRIYNDNNRNYYVTDDWSIEMYEALAYSGFISVSAKDANGKEYLIPEIQFSYAVLHWDNLHVSRRLKQFIKKNVMPDDHYCISMNRAINAVFDGINRYHSQNWMSIPYMNLLKSFHDTNHHYAIKVVSVELWHKHQLIAGEIGYLTGSIYTSLTGFFDRNHYSNFGKIQLLSLALLLKHSGVSFWNMGHPYMSYKFDLGATEYQRDDFLKLWIASRINPIKWTFTNKKIQCNEILNTINLFKQEA